MDEASLEDLACGSASNAGLDTLSAVPWAANKLSKVNYHLTKDDKVRC